MATEEVAPGDAVRTTRTVRMNVFKGDGGQTLVRLGKAAPFGWWPAVILSLVSFLDRLEQSVVAGALPEIKEAFDIGNTGAGLIATFTSIAGLLLFIPAGRIADRAKRTKALAFVLVAWSLLSIGSGLAMTFAMLLAMRTLIGAAGQLNNPASSSLLGDFYPGASRTKVFGIERYVYFLGNPVGVIAGGAIAGAFGWEWVFLGLVIPGFVVAIGCWFLRDPLRGTADRIDAILAGREAEVEEAPTDLLEEADVRDVSVWEDVRHLLNVPTLRAIYICQLALYFGLGGLFYFTPVVFHDVYGVATEKAAAYSGSIGLVGVSIGAFLGIKLGSKFHGIRPGWRVTLSAIGLAIGTSGVAVLATSQSLAQAVVGFLVVNIGFMIAIPNLAATVADLANGLRRGMAFSVNQMVVGIASACSPLIIGQSADILGFNGTYALMVPPLAAGAFLAYRARGGYERDARAVIDEELAA